MFLSRNKKNNVYPCKAQFYYLKVGFKEVKIMYVCFRDEKYGLYKDDKSWEVSKYMYMCHTISLDFQDKIWGLNSISVWLE